MGNYLKYNLQFFADGPGGEKTEEPTTKKLNDAREEGQVAKSTELITASSLATLFIILKVFIGTIGTKFLEMFQLFYYKIPDISKTDFNVNAASGLFSQVLLQILKVSIPVILSAFIVALLVNVIQVKWKVSAKPLKPKLDKINPLKGFKRIISKDKIFDLIKSVLKVGFMFYLVYVTLKDEWKTLMNLFDIPLNKGIELIGSITINLGFKISIFFLAVGFVDLFSQRMKFKKDMMMTKQEVKDEFKQSEGDPQVKNRIRSKMREVSGRRMMQALPEADVVITNPTHLAVAIKYDKDSNSAPVVIAKGADYMALKIKDMARENKIEIVENKPLARMLYYNVDLDSEIPSELYQMVAEVLAYVYGLKNNMS